MDHNLSEIEKKNVHVLSTPPELFDHFLKDFLNQLYLNQSFIHITLEDQIN